MLAIDLIPPGRGNYPVTPLSFDGGCYFVAIDGFDVFFGVGGGTLLNFVRETNGGIYPVRIEASLLDSLVKMFGPDYLAHYLISLTRSGSSAKGLEGNSCPASDGAESVTIGAGESGT